MNYSTTNPSTIATAVLVLGQLICSLAWADQLSLSGTDKTAPVIEHTPVTDHLSANAPLILSATVTDESEITSVVLHFRTKGEMIYLSIVMKPMGKAGIYSTLGQLVINRNNPAKQIDIKNLKTGLYILKIYSGNKTITKKILISQ